MGPEICLLDDCRAESLTDLSTTTVDCCGYSMMKLQAALL